jgi:hypothetical protein
MPSYFCTIPRSKKLLLFFFWLTFLLIVFLYNKDPKGTRLDFEIALHEVDDSPKRGEFYFDTGDGFKANQYIQFNYHTSANGIFSRYTLILQTNRIDRLRYDPLPAAGKVTIKNVIVTKYSSNFLEFSKNEKDIIPLQSIERIEKKGRALTITSNGNDPYLIIAKNVTPFSVSDIGNLIRNIWMDTRFIEIDKFLAGIMALVLLSGLITYFIHSDHPD